MKITFVNCWKGLISFAYPAEWGKIPIFIGGGKRGVYVLVRTPVGRWISVSKTGWRFCDYKVASADDFAISPCEDAEFSHETSRFVRSLDDPNNFKFLPSKELTDEIMNYEE